MSLNSRIKWILTFRALFLAVMAGSGWVLEYFYQDSMSRELLVFLAAGVFFEILSAALHAASWSSRVLAWSQIIFDIGFTSALIHFTGGLSSAYVLLYAVNILIAAILYFSAGAILAAAWASTGFLWVTAGSWWNEIQSNPRLFSRGLFTTSALLFFGAAIAFLFKNRERLAKSLELTTAHLQELSQLHSTIVSHIPSGILFMDASGQVQLMNEAALKILGKSVAGWKLENSELASLLQLDGRYESKLQVSEGEKVLGHHRVILPSGASIIVFQDVTNVRELEGRAQLQEKLAAIGQLGAGIAHEIRNPLASISGSLQLLKNELPMSAQTEKLIRIVLRETDRLQMLTQNFLDYAKPSQSRLMEVDLAETFEHIKALLSHSDAFKEKHPRFEVELFERSPLKCDPKQLEQILWNLVKNAVDASPVGGEIKIRITSDGKMRRFEISDAGPGIPLENQKKIFDPFFTTKATGTGLGLALVYQMVRSHGGAVSAESMPGRGAKFIVDLPEGGLLASHGEEQDFSKWTNSKKVGGVLV